MKTMLLGLEAGDVINWNGAGGNRATVLEVRPPEHGTIDFRIEWKSGIDGETLTAWMEWNEHVPVALWTGEKPVKRLIRETADALGALDSATLKCPHCSRVVFDGGTTTLRYEEEVLDWRHVELDFEPNAEAEIIVGCSNEGDGEVRRGLLCGHCFEAVSEPEGEPEWEVTYS